MNRFLYLIYNFEWWVLILNFYFFQIWISEWMIQMYIMRVWMWIWDSFSLSLFYVCDIVSFTWNFYPNCYYFNTFFNTYIHTLFYLFIYFFVISIFLRVLGFDCSSILFVSLFFFSFWFYFCSFLIDDFNLNRLIQPVFWVEKILTQNLFVCILSVFSINVIFVLILQQFNSVLNIKIKNLFFFPYKFIQNPIF